MVIENFYYGDKQTKVIETTGFDWTEELNDDIWFHIHQVLKDKGVLTKGQAEDITDYVSAKLVITIEEVE
jgi:hypothetical protein